MSRAGRRAAFGAVLVAFAGLTAWLLRPAGPGPEPEDLATEADPPVVPPPAELAGLGGAARTSKGRPLRLPRGVATIQGIVLRDGAPVAARVAVGVEHVGAGYTPWRRGGAWWYESALASPPSPESAAAVVRAGADGRFSVAEIAAGAYTLIAEAEDGARGTVLAIVPADGARVAVTIHVAGGPETLRGRVVHADGRAFVGTVVVGPAGDLRGGLAFSPEGQAVSLDAEGRFVAGGLATGPVVVTARAEGRFVVRGAAITLPYAGEYVLTVDAGLAQRAGRVVRAEDEAPVPGADVYAGGQARGQTSAISRATTDAEGRFEVWVPDGPATGLFVRAEGFAPQQRQIPGSADAESLVIRLARGATVTGRVTRDVDGAPAPGLSVTTLPVGTGEGFYLVDPATTDTDGHYTLTGVAPGDAVVAAQGQGYVTKGLEQGTSRGYNPLAIALRSGETVTQDLVVTAGARIDGVTLDASGAPVPGAVVSASVSAENLFMRGMSGFAPAPVASDREGRFALEGLLSGLPCSLSAEAPGFAPARAGPTTPVVGTATSVEIRFAPARNVEVTVLDDAAGTPVAGARLLPLTWGGSGQLPLTFVTAADGRARVGPLPPQRQQFRVEAAGYAALVVAIAEGDTTTVVRLVPGLEVAGKVVWSDGSPASGVTVWAGAGTGMEYGSAPSTGADGGFVLRGVAAGSATLTARGYRAGLVERAQVTVEAGTRDALIRLLPATGGEGARRLVVRVLGPDGRSVPRAAVTLRTGSSSHGTSAVDGRAEVQVPARETEEAYVDVSGARGADGAPLPYGPATVRVPREATEVEVRLPAELAVTGTVRAPDGAPVRGVVVSARVAEGGEGVTRNFQEVGGARTDPAGSFRVGGLGAGDYDLSFAVPPEFAPVKPVRVRGGDRDVDVRLRRGTTANVTVLDASNQPVSGAGVRARPKAQGAYARFDPRFPGEGRVATGPDGVAVLRGLDPGEAYVLEVSGKGDDLGSATVDPWSPRDETVRLRRVWALAGVVRDPSGRPVPGATVMRKEGTGWTGTGTDAEGRFRFQGLPLGDVVLRASIGQFAPDVEDGSPEVRVATGTKDVVLTLDVGLELRVRLENPGEYGEPWGQAALVVKRDGKTLTPMAYGNVSETFRFQGLRAGDECTFWLGPPGALADRSAYAPGLKPGADVRVRVAAGRAITGRLRAPLGAADLQVSASQDGIGVGGRVNPDGTFEVRGLPEGTAWQVSAYARSADGKTWFTGQATAKPGDTVEIEVKPPPEPSK